MRGVIKGLLYEELQNSLRMKKAYEQELNGLPKGSLLSKNIKGHDYFYLVKRIGKKVKFFYKGKVSDAEKQTYKIAKARRAQLRKLLSQVKKQIRFLKGTLRGKEAI